MKVTQIKTIVNDITKEVLGEENILKEDLSNIVDAGTGVLSSATNKEQFTKLLTDRIARVEIENRIYGGLYPSLYRDQYEWGSAREVVDLDMPEATETQDWNLVDGQDYPETIFYQPKGVAKFYNSKTTFTVPISITNEQLKTAFLSATEMYSFVNGIEVAVRNSIQVKKDALAQRVVNSLIADTLYSEYPAADYGAKSGVRAINLLKLYNVETGKALQAENALRDADFLRFASMQIMKTADRMTVMSKLFNVAGRAKFTSKDLMHTILLSDFKRAMDSELLSSTFHDEYVKLKELGHVEEAVYWQASGKNYDLASVSSIQVKSAMGNDVTATGILGVIFDHYAAGITQDNPRTDSKYVASASFTNEWHKQDCSYFENLNNNCVVFFIA